MNKQCIWIEDTNNPPNTVRCINCGIYRRDPKLIRICGQQNKSLLSKGAAFVREYSKWKLRGGQYRSDEEIDRIYKICETCEYFKPQEKYGICGICECNLKPSEDKEMNKIAMSTTRCAAEEPLWIEIDGAKELEEKFISQEQQEVKKEAAQDEPPQRKGCGCKKKTR